MKKLITLFFALCVANFASSAAVGGDVNGDNAVNVSDVTALVNQIIGSGSYSVQACDVNGDGQVNVSDVTALVNLIINGGGESQLTDQTFTVNGVSFDMIAVEGGTFTMGATEEQGKYAFASEKPAHQVTLSSFYIGKTEVTQELWRAVMDSNPSGFMGDLRPVEKVSWDDCQEFITKLNELTGKTFRLPTEAEWEYAARGGNKSQGYLFSGSNTREDVAWFNCAETATVATKAPNELGIYDMSGNVHEWCSDWFDADYYSNSPQSNPTGPETGTSRVIRGGSRYSYDITSIRVAKRGYSAPNNRSRDIGFRLAL
ncbi:MAG: SUMF1/EgtB/PvdO family nonheme iron enzyme [Sodaliphilus sp.]